MNGLRLKTELAGLNCTASAFSANAVPPITSRKLTQQKISAILANQEDFSSPTEAAEFFGAVETMKVLQEHVFPFVPINWSDGRVKDALIQTFEKRRNESDPIHHRAWFVRLSISDYFKGLRSDGTEIRTLNYFDGDAVAFTNYELAAEVVKRLKQRDIPAKAEALTCERRQSTITLSLEELGL